MWISRKKYEEKEREREEYYSTILSNLQAYQDDCEKLRAENETLAALVNGKTEGCEIGPWCEGCKHKGVIHGDVSRSTNIYYPNKSIKEVLIDRREIVICLKHIHEMCHEFESKYGRGEDK